MAGWMNLLPKPPKESAADVYDNAIKASQQRQQAAQTAQYNSARIQEAQATAQLRDTENQQKQRAIQGAQVVADEIQKNTTYDPTTGEPTTNYVAIHKGINDRGYPELGTSVDDAAFKQLQDHVKSQQSRLGLISQHVGSVQTPDWNDPQSVQNSGEQWVRAVNGARAGGAISEAEAAQYRAMGVNYNPQVEQLRQQMVRQGLPDAIKQTQYLGDVAKNLHESRMAPSQESEAADKATEAGEALGASHIAAGVAPVDSSNGATPVTVSPTSAPAGAPVKTAAAPTGDQVAAAPTSGAVAAPIAAVPAAPQAPPAKYTGPPQAPGLVTPGNIDLANRPIVKNADGTTSTVKTATFGIDGGRTVLLPTIVNGAPVSNADAFKHYEQTGEHMGIFQNEDAAEQYDKALHNQMGWNGAPGSPQAAWQATAAPGAATSAAPAAAAPVAPPQSQPPTDPYLAGQQALWDAQRADPANKGILKYMPPTWSQKAQTTVERLNPKFKEQQEILNGQVQQAVGSLAANPPQDAAAYGKFLDGLPDAVSARIQGTVPLAQYDPKESPSALNQSLLTPEQRFNASKPLAGRNPTETELALAVAKGRNKNATPAQVQEGQDAEVALRRLDQSKIAARPVNQTFLPGTGPGGPTPANPNAPAPLTGEAYLKTLTPSLAAQVRQIAAGAVTLPSANNRSQAALQLRDMVFHFDPEFSEQRAQVRKAFTTGADGKNIGALNTAPVHLDQLGDAALAMDNGTFRPGNAAWNYVRTAFGSDAVSNFNGLKAAVSSEMASALKGNATDQEIKNIQSTVESSSSPKQLAGIINTNLGIAAAKLQTYQERYSQQIPNDHVWSPVLPSARAVFEKHGIAAGSQVQGGGGGGNAKVYTQANVDAAVKAHPGLTADQAEQAFKAKGWVKQ